MTFQHPVILALIALLIPVTLLLMIDGQRRLRKQLGVFISKRLQPSLTDSFSSKRVWIRNSLMLASLILLGLGSARPQWGSEERELEGRGIDIVFALDASKSMLAEDIIPSRIERSKLAIQDFIKTMKGDRVGIVAFAGDAFLQCPLTFDMNAFRMTLKSIVPGIIPHRGTDIAAAIDEARSVFPEGDNAKILILMTDGEDLEESGIQAARDAKEDGITIYTVGVGGATGARIPVVDRFGDRSFMANSDGSPVITRLDAATLQEIATAAGGLYVPLGASGNGLQRLYEARLSQIPDELRETTIEQIPHERYAWFVIPGLICFTAVFFVGNRRSQSGIRSAIVLLGVLGGGAFPQKAEAQRASYRAYDALLNENWEQAASILSTEMPDSDESAINAYNLGLAHFQLNEFEAAESAFESALNTGNLELQADAFYNLGLARVSKALGVDASAFDLVGINKSLRESFDNAYQSLQLGELAIEEIPMRRQAWTQCEQVLDALRALEEQLSETSEPATNRRNILNSAMLAWTNAKELDEAQEDAANNLLKLEELLNASEDDWLELDRHQEALPEVDAALENMIRELKKPTPAVIEAEALADRLVANHDYFDAVDLLEGIAENDPTADVYREKQKRLREIVDILAPPTAPNAAQPPGAERLLP